MSSNFDMKVFEASLVWRDKVVGAGAGRRQLASDALRANFYRDENGRRQLVTELKPWHERIVDKLLLNPTWWQKDVAEAFGVTQSWVSQLMNSDSFKAYYSMRVKAHQEAVSLEIREKIGKMTSSTLDVMNMKVKAGAVSFPHMVEAAALGLKSLGFGVGPAVNVNMSSDSNVTFVSVQKDGLERARELIAQKRKENSAALEGKHTTEEYVRITASMELGEADMEVEDAVVVAGEFKKPDFFDGLEEG